MLQVGSIVKVKDNAYEGSDDPADFEWRGKIGEVVGDYRDGTYEVRIGDNWLPLRADEIAPEPGVVLYDKEPKIRTTERYQAALIELLRAEVEMMCQHDPDWAETWTWGRVRVVDLANSRGLEFEFGGDEDMPNDGLGQFAIRW